MIHFALTSSIQLPDQAPARLLASLHAVDVSHDDHVAVDDEGGTRVTNSKTRFIAPALAVLTLRATIDQPHHELENDGDAGEIGTTSAAGSGSLGGRSLGGFLGFGMLGVGLAQISHPVGVALAIVGVARTVYSNVLGRGDDVAFPADTPIQVQIAPGADRDSP